MKRFHLTCLLILVLFQATSQNITSAEYFFDIDPGAGNGTVITITPGASIQVNASIPTASLNAGFHTLCIRTRNSDGLWSLYESRPVYISTATGNVSGVANAEYFIDADPGPGNGSPLSINTPGAPVSENYVIPVPAGISNGTHYLGIRTQDVEGNWTLFEIDSFTVSGALPLHWGQFRAERNAAHVLLEWITHNEVNTSHFEVERSANGIEFTKIGTVLSEQQAYNKYNYTDSFPLKGVNYYRLKQVDADEKFSYSSTQVVLFSEPVSSLVMYPNPVRDKLRIEIPRARNAVLIQLYDAGGRLIRTTLFRNQQNMLLKVEDLPSGFYTVLVSDGINRWQGTFIRE